MLNIGQEFGLNAQAIDYTPYSNSVRFNCWYALKEDLITLWLKIGYNVSGLLGEDEVVNNMSNPILKWNASKGHSRCDNAKGVYTCLTLDRSQATERKSHSLRRVLLWLYWEIKGYAHWQHGNYVCKMTLDLIIKLTKL